MITTEQLEALCGWEFDASDITRAGAIIDLVTAAVEGVLGRPAPEDPPPALVAVVSSASLRMFQNKGGVQQESIGGFSAAYPFAGRVLNTEEVAMVRASRGTAVTSIRITTDATQPEVTTEEV